MSPNTSSLLGTRSARLAGSSVVRRGDQWWLVSGSGSVLSTDVAFTRELDRFAAAMTAADQAVAALCPQKREPRRRGRR
ncbi:hypothetical protein C8250_015460 [Streptomyces sp. So13.3]|uniref:hypothetical protein n=1 Tax=unclassified Streptomyces TaxID=2593676 RepID=UPI0011068034|nr:MULTISPECIES: hypothetical protein [unclassified Streptomyces]NEA75446.1 hypothetical protein [Streptomyces sp. SID13588]QNA73125.1 hypothetical protein C8250_015460 [Streptomyces sp. So13.3]